MIYSLLKEIYDLTLMEDADNAILEHCSTCFGGVYYNDLHKIFHVEKINERLNFSMWKYFGELELTVSPDTVEVIKNTTDYNDAQSILGWINEFKDLASAEFHRGIQKYQENKASNMKLEMELNSL